MTGNDVTERSGKSDRVLQLIHKWGHKHCINLLPNMLRLASKLTLKAYRTRFTVQNGSKFDVPAFFFVNKLWSPNVPFPSGEPLIAV